MNNENRETIDEKPHSLRLTIKNIPAAISNNRMLLSFIVFLYLLPLVTGARLSPERALINIITQIMIFGLLAMSFDLQLGRAGLLNFGHVALFGVGAFFVAFTLNTNVFPELNIIPYPIALIIAMSIGAILGFIMGLTTNRMKGTAFAFIALAISMFLYNYFAQNPSISGGETGLRVAIPGIMTTAPFYLFFVIIAFIVFISFFGMVILYVKKRTESVGPFFFVPVMVAFIVVLLVFNANIIGPILLFIGLVGMCVLYWMERNNSIRDPLQYVNVEETLPVNGKHDDILTTYVLPLSILALITFGIIVAFGNNIAEMVSLWFENTDTFLYRIPVQYYLVLSCVVSTFIFIKRLISSPFGRMVTAVAQNQQRAEALGYNSYFCKIIILMISGAIAALAGGLYAPFIRTIDPHTGLGVEITINAMLYTIIGGIGTLFGPLLGAGVVEYSQLNLVNFISSLGLPGELWLVGLGVAYVVIVLFLPLGIVGSASIKSRSIKERLQRVKIGKFEFGINEGDYWVFTLIGTIGLFMLLLFLNVTI
ncbi:branched-chain amino acid ABC transporter permease [Candidatus Thorarchaeota archaeon]|nr:MAG: branched-chain amino acid ABC transporter permease [Candidatus Thorarchaeota archaeon]